MEIGREHPSTMIRILLSRVALLAAFVGLLALATEELAAQEARNPGEWLSHGGDLTAQRYSPLDQIDASNVDQLEIAWRWTSRNFGPQPESQFRGSALMVDRILYATAGFRRAAVAIDPVTGETLWMHRLDEGERGRLGPRFNSGRGVAYWRPENGDENPRIIYITPGYHMIALDAKNGVPVQEFGESGIVDLMDTLREREGVGPVGSIGNSSPPLVVGDVLVVGSALHVGFRPPSPANIPGDIRGFDARTGELLWRFNVVPENGEFGADTWEDGSNEYTGNAGVWTTFSADPDLGLVYLPTEAATSDMYGGHRLGDNLFSSSLVALDVNTGERVWHYQLVHHDVWDYDTPTAPILADIVVDGREISAVAQITKQGWVFVFDRATGEPVWPIVERPVPASDVPGERTSPTQPFPTKPPAFTRQGVTVDDLVDFTPELRQRALKAVADLKLGPLFTPGVVSEPENGYLGTLMVPSVSGGANWQGGTYDPEMGILYVASLESSSVIGLVPGSEPSGMRYVVGTGLGVRVDGIPVLKPPYGKITAIDLNRGEIVWQMANGDTPDDIANHPLLQGTALPRTGNLNRAGLLATRTLLFSGEGVGGTPAFRAHDKATGETLAEFEIPATQTGMPMSYVVDGKQYVVVGVGDGDTPAELVAFALP